jgi:putative ABC transport system permease protein
MKYTIVQFIRSLSKRKTTSVINIGGYAISMSVLFILVSFIIGEKSTNKGFGNRKNIYRILPSNEEAYVPATLLDDIKNNVPGVEKMCLYGITEQLYKTNGKQEYARFISTNDDFIDMFSLRFIYGSSESTLSVANNIILTKSFSERLFGKSDPVGQFLQIRNKNWTVAGVVDDLPVFTSFRFDALAPLNFFIPWSKAYGIDENHDLYGSFLQLGPGVDYEKTNNRVTGMLKHWQVFRDVTLSLQPLSEVYFSSVRGDTLEHANARLIYLLSGIALVIFVMTIFNYTNITIANGYERQAEIGIRKTTGAGRKDIFRQVLTESLLVSLLSMTIAIAIAFAVAPVFSGILGKKIELEVLLSKPGVIISGILILLGTGILSGLYPALSFSGMSPMLMITRQPETRKRKSGERMVAVQFLITSVLIISLLFMQKQLAFVKHTDLGFDKEMLLRLDLAGSASQKAGVLKKELLRNPDIVSVSASSGSPMQTIGSSGGKFNVDGQEKAVSFSSFSVDEDFVNTFGVKVIEGRNFRNGDSIACLINENLYKELGWSEITGKSIFGKAIIGVVKDFHYENLYTEMGNLELQMEGAYARVLNIKMQGNIANNIDYIKKTYNAIEPEVPLSYRFYDDWIQSMYEKDERQAQAVGLFALLAIIISCLGLIGTVEHVTNRKVKEIGIRRINGARVAEILEMLNKGFIKWIAIAFVLAVPVTYYIVKKWLEAFAYKTELSWWIFALAGIMALGIALLTVSFQSWKAATRNPVEALRYE